MRINASAHRLPLLEDESVHCIVTSPPYFGLRRYHSAYIGVDLCAEYLDTVTAQRLDDGVQMELSL